MAVRTTSINLYKKDLKIPIYRDNKCLEERIVNVTVDDADEKLYIKLRDASEYMFNYTEYIDLGDFEIIRHNQSLDIDYEEFKLDLVEMLEQIQRGEMLLKCQLRDQKCMLVFYNRSKIKCIVFLTLELKLTNQTEIIQEMSSQMQRLQEINGRSEIEVVRSRRAITEKDKQINRLNAIFKENVNKIEMQVKLSTDTFLNAFSLKLPHILKKISDLEVKIRTLTVENTLKNDSSTRLVKTLEDLRLENMENEKVMHILRRENTCLNGVTKQFEKEVVDMRRTINEKEEENRKLQEQKKELEEDCLKVTYLVKQKQKALDELSRDLVQANQMLVSFNKHYDDQLEKNTELQATVTQLESKNIEQESRLNQLADLFEEYKKTYNIEGFDLLKGQNAKNSNRIAELEEECRKLHKMNRMLTDKINRSVGLYD